MQLQSDCLRLAAHLAAHARSIDTINTEDVPFEMVVVKSPLNCKTPRLVCNPDYLACTLNSQSFTALIQRRKQHLDPDVRSDWWALCAKY
jgi:hypothetical protein